MSVIRDRRPESVFRFFEEISAIPRGSFHEGEIAAYLERFAKTRGLWCVRDAENNVFIKAPATKGYEDRPALLFQGHTDMVCEKNGDVEHDFLHDPIRLKVEGKYLCAEGTTLGGDDGIAVAIMLALLDGEVPAHPAYECLFTTAEEVGLNGAEAFDYSLVSARRMINMDSEELGVVTCGCAGGMRSDLTLSYQPEPFRGTALRVKITGLAGGHSGENIKDGRANANKVAGRLLAALLRTCDARVVSVAGGSKDNAIPRECELLLAVPDAGAAIDLISDTAAAIGNELGAWDRGFTVRCEEEAGEGTMLGKRETASVAAILACAANGVFEMSYDVPGLVEWSRNLGVVTSDDGKIDFVFSSRSSIESRLDASAAELDALAAATGCTARHYARYPGWEFAEKSALRDTYCRIYREVTGKDAQVNVIHAGLECGIIHSRVPDMDLISVGPTMHDIHSPNEKLDLDATEVFFETIRKLINA